MAILKKGTAYTRAFLMVSSTDHISAKTGSTGSLAVSISKAGSTFASAGGSLTELGNGFYSVALTTADTDTNGDLAFHCTATSADPTDFVDQVTTQILGDTLTANATQLAGQTVTAAAGVTFPTSVASPSNITAATGVALTSAYDFAKGTAAMTEAYAANGAAPTPVQALYGIHQMLMDFGITGTSYTVKKLDNSTTAFVVTLDSSSAPTAAART